MQGKYNLPFRKQRSKSNFMLMQHITLSLLQQKYVLCYTEMEYEIKFHFLKAEQHMQALHFF